MPQVIRVLRASGIGAHSAADPRGLDAVVANAIERASSSGPDATSTGLPVSRNESEAVAVGGSSAKRRRETDAASAPSPAAPAAAAAAAAVAVQAKKRSKGETERGGGTTGSSSSGDTAASSEWGFKWGRELSTRLIAFAEDGVRRKQLRKAVLREYLSHLAQQRGASEDLRWWKAHKPELKALFRKHLRQAKQDGRLRTQGKMVRRP